MADELYSGYMIGSKPLLSLRVIDLKTELDKRGLSKSGTKKDLQERLRRQIQLEKLQAESIHNASNNDQVPNLSLQDDAIGSQNEVVKQYLAEQQKTYAIQKEARRQIELSADEVGPSDTEASSSQDEGLTPKSEVSKRGHSGGAINYVMQEKDLLNQSARTNISKKELTDEEAVAVTKELIVQQPHLHAQTNDHNVFDIDENTEEEPSSMVEELPADMSFKNIESKAAEQNKMEESTPKVKVEEVKTELKAEIIEMGEDLTTKKTPLLEKKDIQIEKISVEEPEEPENLRVEKIKYEEAVSVSTVLVEERPIEIKIDVQKIEHKLELLIEREEKTETKPEKMDSKEPVCPIEDILSSAINQISATPNPLLHSAEANTMVHETKSKEAVSETIELVKEIPLKLKEEPSSPKTLQITTETAMDLSAESTELPSPKKIEGKHESKTAETSNDELNGDLKKSKNFEKDDKNKKMEEKKMTTEAENESKRSSRSSRKSTLEVEEEIEPKRRSSRRNSGDVKETVEKKKVEEEIENKRGSRSSSRGLDDIKEIVESKKEEIIESKRGIRSSSRGLEDIKETIESKEETIESKRAGRNSSKNVEDNKELIESKKEEIIESKRAGRSASRNLEDIKETIESKEEITETKRGVRSSSRNSDDLKETIESKEEVIEPKRTGRSSSRNLEDIKETIESKTEEIEPKRAGRSSSSRSEDVKETIDSKKDFERKSGSRSSSRSLEDIKEKVELKNEEIESKRGSRSSKNLEDIKENESKRSSRSSKKYEIDKKKVEDKNESKRSSRSSKKMSAKKREVSSSSDSDTSSNSDSRSRSPVLQTAAKKSGSSSDNNSSSEDERKKKRRSSTSYKSPNADPVEILTEKSILPKKRTRKWSSNEISGNEERRKITRNTTMSKVIVEMEEKTEKVEEINDKKDVIDLHVRDEAMEVSDIDKDIQEKDAIKKSVISIETKTEESKLESLEKETPIVEKSVEIKKITNRKISVSGSKDKEDTGTEKPQRRRKWGSLSKAVPKSTPSISTESLKDLIPDIKNSLSVISTIPEEIIPKETSNKENIVLDINNSVEKKLQSSSVGRLPAIKTRKVENPVVSTEPVEAPPPSPARNPISNIIHVKNLVRPFTLPQLKEVLGKTGTLVDDGFWIDKIKSKCYVTYENEEQAVESRAALHGCRWPTSNPKTLMVDFSTADELTFHKDAGKSVLPPKPEPSVDHSKEVGGRRPSDSTAFPSERPRRLSAPNEAGKDDQQRFANRKSHDRDRGRAGHQNEPQQPIREWDRDKLVQDEGGKNQRGWRERRQSREKEESLRTRKEKKERKEPKKKQEEETPGKLLDDLFKKTKSMPCIYWLPLTDVQIVQRDEQRKLRSVEREKRREKMDLEERKREENERKLRQKERESRMIRDRPMGRRSLSRSRSRSPVRRR